MFGLHVYGTFLTHVQKLQCLAAIGGLIVVALLSAGCAVLAFLKMRQLFYEKEQYRLVMEQKDTIWLDYHFSPQHLQVSGSVSPLTELNGLDMMGVEVYEIYDWVHPDDASIRSRIRQFFDSDEGVFRTDLRLKKLNGEYGWYSCTGVLVRNKKDQNERYVMALENVDSQMTQEMTLVEKAENDLLTGIFNKKTMEERVAAALLGRRENDHYIFFMIDLDNFKAVNDTLGHIYGDRVLADAAKKLKELFGENGMVGRLGGDEFAACICFEAFDEENLLAYMREKGARLCETLRDVYHKEELCVKISASVGIASAPENGVEFESIYQKADKALYLSKRSGKDRYNIYEKSDANE